ncbi:unnamed protein product [Cylicostephanus goldi]|uniref:Uncharacterized protein n=1 Tax=Cylicostephanus goldi TaxID=71465 RepID=A0A3P6QLK9_CYLGO|nr:unnamed protein product [Cylicostephanus goldi]
MDITREVNGIGHRAGLTNLSPTCFVAPKATGIVSLILQFAILVVSVLVALFFFYHVGGYEYMGWNENSTILEPISHARPLDSSALEAPVTVSLIKRSELKSVAYRLDFSCNISKGHGFTRAPLDTKIFESGPLNVSPAEEDKAALMENVDTKQVASNTSSLLSIEQVPNTTIYLDFLDARLDMLELIRISTLVYVGTCILWLISIALLLLSIKFEILDMVIVNAIFLTIATMYAFVHALFIAVLLYYQRDLSWRTMAIIIGSVIILICTTILGGVALALVVGWYRYIVYMNDSEKCFCLHGIVQLIKRRKRTPQQAAQEYAMPHVTRHNDLPYADETAVNNFTAF